MIHELSTSGSKPKVVGTNAYTSTLAGGTSAVVVGTNRKEVDSYVTNAGTWVNCAGGAFWFDDTQGEEARRGQIYRLGDVWCAEDGGR